MSAVTTKKPGGDLAVQLTFPSVYSDAYASGGYSSTYYPAGAMRPEVLPAGDDLQSLYHEQKRIDANRMAMARVHSRQASDDYFLKSHQNYIVPKPVLSQRQFANPSNGNQADIYAARYNLHGGLSGGVLRTRKGQEFAKSKLRERVGQLDAIEQAKQGFLSGLPVQESISPDTLIEQAVEPIAPKALLDLVGQVTQFYNAIMEGSLTSIGIADFYKSLRLLFRLAPAADRETLENMLSIFYEIQSVLVQAEGEDIFQREIDYQEDDKETKDRYKMLRLLGNAIPSVVEYLEQMIRTSNLNAKERRSVSANLIKNLGFTKFNSEFASAEKEALMQKSRASARGVAERKLDDLFGPSPPDGPPPPDDDDEEDDSPGGGPGRARGPRFDPSPRANWASRSGVYFGEAFDESDMPTSSAQNPMRRMTNRPGMVAPIASALPSFANIPERVVEEAEDDDAENSFTSAPEAREDSQQREAIAAPVVIRRKKPKAAAAAAQYETEYPTLAESVASASTKGSKKAKAAPAAAAPAPKMKAADTLTQMGFVERPRAAAAPAVAAVPDATIQGYFTAYADEKGYAPTEYDKRLIRAIVENDAKPVGQRLSQTELAASLQPRTHQSVISKLRKSIGLR